MKTGSKIAVIIVIVVLLGLAAFCWVKFYFVLGTGVKAGELNQIVYKGWVWKTYEGRLIQSGFKGAKGGGSIQSNEFNFSVEDPAVADSLMKCSGKLVQLHYKEYNGALPWRGMQKHIVDGILAVKPIDNQVTAIPITGED